MTNTDAYSTGYAIGTMAFLLTLGLIFWRQPTCCPVPAASPPAWPSVR